MKIISKSLVVQAALAGLFASAAVVPVMADDAAMPAKAPAKKGAKMVHCYGINSCKGQGDCAGDGHSCKGQNLTKETGWKSLTKKECKDKKGTTKAPKKV